MRAFIIRPFGTKNDINFDLVEANLIGPALERLGVTGRTTLDILRAGNIRIDMFQRLLTADLVVADVSVHNANVFYELGIRHALRDKRTLMIRCDADKFPFDLQTDRYFTYDKGNPVASLTALVEALRQTINSEEQDSPVFKLLPNLQAQDRSRFLAVPLDFREEVERAAAARQVGDLELLADELQGFEWASEGLRVVGRALFGLRAFKGAGEVWEQVREIDTLDLEANTWLGTIYQRLGDLTRADQTVNRLLIDPLHLEANTWLGTIYQRLGELTGTDFTRQRLMAKQRAELYSLLGRNAKTRWRADWEGAPPAERRVRALSSTYLYESYEAYDKGFIEDLNHFYSGLNALALLRVTEELARMYPDVWEGRFETEAASRYELDMIREKIEKLSAGVALSLRAENERLKRAGQKDVWVEFSEADLSLLTSKRPPRVAVAYREALAGAPPFAADAARGQVLLYRELDVMTDNVQSALSVLGEPPPAPVGDGSGEVVKPGRILLFAGHMVDAPDRKYPRFPPDKEGVARQAIKEAVERELSLPRGVAFGIAGGASGGDILFHEVCAELGIPTRLFLALPRDEYVRNSVQPAGPRWVERFQQLYDSHQPRVLSESRQESEYLPRWLRDKADYSIWQRNALWMLHNALAEGEGGITLIALWDGKAGDGPGGTADLVQKATERGAKTVILNTGALFAAGQGERAAPAAGGEPVKAVEVLEAKAPSEEPDTFDVFLRYNRADQPAVEEVARQLMKLGIRPWFDQWQLRPGLPWQDELERQIEKIKSAAVFVGKEGIGPWQDMEQDAFLREFRKRRCPVIPVILPEGGEEPRLPIFLAGMTWVDFRSQAPDPMERLIWGITGKRAVPKSDEE
jgi:nucleotide-binding universal stress UspA family protein/tetratricopeptide (TPR) repeat protein